MEITRSEERTDTRFVKDPGSVSQMAALQHRAGVRVGIFMFRCKVSN